MGVSLTVMPVVASISSATDVQAQTAASFCSPPSGSTAAASANCGPGTTTTGIVYSPTSPSFALTFAPGSTVNATSGSDAVYISGSSTFVSVDAPASTIVRSGSSGNDGIYLPSVSGGSVNFGGLIVSEIDHGIHVGAVAPGAGGRAAITVSSTGQVYGYAAGLLASAADGSISVTNAGLVTQGASTITSPALGTITIGPFSGGQGIATNGNGAGNTQVVNSGSIVAEGTGIRSVTSGSGTIGILNSGSIRAGGRYGVYAETSTGSGITIENEASGTISALLGNGIEVDTRGGSGSATITSAGTIDAGTVGILARADSGAAKVVNSGTVTAPIGLVAGSNTGVVTATNSGRLLGATVGIAAGSGAAATVSNTATGQITFGQFGLAAATLAGPLVLSNAGTLTRDASLPSQVSAAALAQLPAAYAALGATGTAGIFGRTGGANLSVTNSGAITGAVGIDAAILRAPNAPSGGTLFITNSGSIAADLAIDTTKSVAPANIINTGTINGALSLNAGSSFANDRTGVFNATGTSSFGGGTLVNAGAISLGSGGAFAGSLGRDVTLAGLSSFMNLGEVFLVGSSANLPGTISFGSATISAAAVTNAGTFNLQNGRAGDTLTINGNYVGQNGRVNLDVSTQGGSADRLVVNGNASGTTALNLLNVSPGAAFSLSPVLVQVNGQQSAGAFTLGSVQNFGALDVSLLSGRAGTEGGTTVSLVTVPSAVGQSGTVAVLAAQSIAFQGGSAVLDRVTQLRRDAQRVADGAAPANALQYAGSTQYAALVSKDPIAPNLVPVAAPPSNVKPAVWARAFGDLERRSGFSSLTFASTNFGTDLGYSQSTGGLMAGADLVISGLTAPDDGLILGVLGGYTTASVRLNQSAARQDYDGGTVGGYATYLKGAFFADVLFKTDLLGLDITAPGVRQSTGLQNYNVLGNIGYRFDLPHALYIEPTAGLEYVATVFDRTPALAAGSVPLQDGDAFRGRIGARLGTEFVENNIRVEPSITGLIYDVFTESGTTTTFGSGTRLTGLTNVGKVRGEIQASINFLNLKTGLSGFLRADYRIGDDLLGGGGRAGIRYQW